MWMLPSCPAVSMELCTLSPWMPMVAWLGSRATRQVPSTELATVTLSALVI
jgi:hypothetical protein